MKETTTRKEQIKAAFEQCHGSTPMHWLRAPGRVDLMGSHTDYNLGCVLTLPIGRDTWMAVTPRTDRRVHLYSLNLKDQAEFSLDAISKEKEHAWCNYVRGVAKVLQEEKLALTGFNGVVHSTVPMSSGLSSSAALECVTATVFEALGEWTLDPVQKARLCQRAENQFVGVNCGILDQYTSCMGQEGCALLLDCRDLSSRPAKLADDIQVVICDTKYKRELAGSEYGQRRAQCEEGARLMGAKALREVSLLQFAACEKTLPVDVAKRCRFIIEENARVESLAVALTEGNQDDIRKITAVSFDGACNLYEIAAPAMHSMMQAMLNGRGVIGARQAGAGFGGCMVAFVKMDRVPEFVQDVMAKYKKETGVEAEVYPVKAAAGAGQLAEERQNS